MLDYVEQGSTPQRGLGLVGPVGCGKTPLLVTAYKLTRATPHASTRGVPASAIQFVSGLDLLNHLRTSFDEDKRTGEARSGQL